VATATRRLKHWGWGYEDQQPPRDQIEGIAKAVTDRLGFEVDQIEEPVPLDAVELPAPRLRPPAELGAMFSDDPYDRISHSLGKAYRDVVRGFRGEFANPPDLVAYPESAEDVDTILNLCSDEGAAAIPFGGGTSVVGGVEPRMRDEYPAVVTIDLRRMDRVLEVDPISKAARIQAGATGPGLE
jgi:alkyldihydroxyacetonephosphate synthase